MARGPKTDVPVLPGAPRAYAGPKQQDGTPTTMLEQAPPKFSQGGPRPMQTRAPTAGTATQSGLENSMGALADKLHPRDE